MSEQTKEVAKRELNPLQVAMKNMNLQKVLQNTLGKKSTQFMVSLNNAYEDYLKDCTPESVIKSSMMAAAVDLPIEKNLGFAYLIPYKGVCSFQIGYKGLIQLAQRTCQYETINAIEVYAEQFKSYNPLTEELILDFTVDVDYSKDPVGYVAHFKLLNGFKKTLYWTRERCVQHSIQFSQSFKYKDKYGNIWNGNTNAMHLKTVLKQVLSKYGVLSIEMQKALNEDIEYDKKDMPKTVEKPKVNIFDLNKKKDQEIETAQVVQETGEIIETEKSAKDEILSVFGVDE